ncbi:MAG: hypothetical protein KIT45_07185 [Fimbriimonadia bacterium]|nr:hypothetical protein [Fimbriimonadia bacterium]
MAFDDKMMEEFARFLSESPKWRARMREALLETSEEHFDQRFDRLQETLDRLATSHAQSLERFDRLEESHVKAIERLVRLEATQNQAIERLDRLDESHAKAIERLDRLETTQNQAIERLGKLEESHAKAIERLDRLDESHAKAIERLDRLDENQKQLWEELRELKEIVQRLVQWAERAETDIAKLKGYALELRFLDRAPGFFGYYMRKPKVVNIGRFLDELRDAGQTFTKEEWDQLVALDTLLSAVHPTTGDMVVLTIEVSWMIYPDDIECAHERAAILTSKGVTAFPAAAGEGIAPEALELAEKRKAMVLLDGRAITFGAFAN